MKKIKDIPGKQGFWKPETELKFLRLLKDLIAHGYTQEDAVEFLDGVYWCVAGEFGE
jgi:hypothetical protein